MTISIEEFGRHVARALGSGTQATRLAKQEAAVAAYALRQQRRWSSVPPFRWLAMGTLGVAVAGAGLYLTLGSAPRQSPSALLAGSGLANGLRAFELDDGSQLTAQPGARLEIVDQPDVRVRLISGDVNVHVTKQHARDWILIAGPYRVAVIGTQFDVSFDAASQHFSVRVKEGLVRVFGSDLPSEGMSLHADQEYTTGARSALAEPPSSDGDAGTKPASELLTPLPAARPTSASVGADLPDSPPAAAASTSSWRQACAAGKYDQAFTHGVDGLPQVLDRSSEGELLEFANCLRYAGRSAEAERALLKLRDRFPRSRGAILSSYHLARLSQRKGGRDAAIRWFETYLTESPQGQLAANARAELVRLYSQRGNSARARAAAREYLRHHPRGSFASQAEELLGRSATNP